MTALEITEPLVAPARPIFYDERGKRWKLIRLLSIAVIVTVIATAALLTKAAFTSPISPRDSVEEAGIPVSYSALDAHTIPVIGAGVMQRIVQVRRAPRMADVAVDAASGQVVRYLTPNETRALGTAKYAVEHYGVLPDKQLALTFDDGPDITWTPKILDLLGQYHIQATFCLIGTQVAKYPDIAARVVREGHLLCNHTMTHTDTGTASITRDKAEMTLTNRLIRASTYRETRFFRNPYGGNDVNTIHHDLRSIYTAQTLGYDTLAYDVDSHDWEFETHQRKPVPLDLRDGSGHVVLLHDGGGDRSITLDYLKSTIVQALKLGYKFTTPLWLDHDPKTAYAEITPSFSDRVTFLVARGAFQWVNYLLTFLFYLGIASMFGVTALYLMLGATHEIRQHLAKLPPLKSHTVTAVIAAYNEEAVIESTVLALLRSDHKKLKVVVVDDGSTDRTGEILDRLALLHQGRVRVFHLPNGGKSRALNHAFDRVETELVVTLDADTIFRPATVTYLISPFRDDRVGAVAGFIKVGNIRGLWTAWQALEYITSIGVERTGQSQAGVITVVPGACAAWRRSAVLQVGGYRSDTLAEDCELTLRLQRRKYKVVQSNRAVAYTEAPQRLRPLLKQRFRWTYGNMQALWKHRDMMLRPRYGLLGMVVMPYTYFSLAMPIIFLPVIWASLIASFVGGTPPNVIGYLALFTIAQFVICLCGVVITKSSPLHLLITPFFRVISEPLRAYLIYRSFFAALKGKAHGWNKLQRTGAVKMRGERAVQPRVGDGEPLSTPRRAHPQTLPAEEQHLRVDRGEPGGVERRTSGSVSGLEERTGSNAGTRPRPTQRAVGPALPAGGIQAADRQIEVSEQGRLSMSPRHR